MPVRQPDEATAPAASNVLAVAALKADPLRVDDVDRDYYVTSHATLMNAARNIRAARSLLELVESRRLSVSAVETKLGQAFLGVVNVLDRIEKR